MWLPYSLSRIPIMLLVPRGAVDQLEDVNWKCGFFLPKTAIAKGLTSKDAQQSSVLLGFKL